MSASLAKLSLSRLRTNASHTDWFGRSSNCSAARACSRVVGAGSVIQVLSVGTSVGILDATGFDDDVALGTLAALPAGLLPRGVPLADARGVLAPFGAMTAKISDAAAARPQREARSERVREAKC